MDTPTEDIQTKGLFIPGSLFKVQPLHFVWAQVTYVRRNPQTSVSTYSFYQITCTVFSSNSKWK